MARKLLSLVVALAVVLSSMSFAFAADPKAVSADVTDAKVKNAVEKLVSLGMVEGIDGKYMPDLKLKRSELTKLIVMALGLGPAADAAAGSASQFSDVGADHWAAGYITVAAGQGLVQGMGDGTFAPDSEITFSQALTMLVRALGYKDEFLPGSWPGNYLAKASEKKLDKGVKIVPNQAVKRGDFALMMSNTLDAEIIKIGEYEGTTVKYTETETTLAKEKLDLDKAEVRLTATSRLDSAVKNDEVKGKFTKDCPEDSDIKGTTDGDDTDEVFTLDIASSINPDLYLGMTANVYVNEDDEIVYIEDAGISETYWDGVDKFTGADGDDAAVIPDVKLRWTGKTIPVLGGEDAYPSSGSTEDFATIFKTAAGDTNQWESGKASAFGTKQSFGRFVVEKGKVVFADLYVFENLGDGGYMVKSVDNESGTITYYQGDDENELKVSSKYSKAKYYLSSLDGKISEITIKDLKPFDVLYETESEVESSSVGNFFVFRKTVEGTLTSVVTEDADTLTKLEVDSKTTTDVGTKMTYSLDNNAELEKDATAADIEDFLDTKVTLVIDNNKKVRHVYGEAVASDSMFGVALKVESGVQKQMKVYTSNDVTMTYSFEDEDEIFDDVSDSEVTDNLAARYYNITTGAENFDAFMNDINDYTTGGLTNGDLYHKVVEFKLNKDSKIAENSLKVYMIPTTYTSAMAVNGDFGDDTITLGGEAYYAKDTTKVFDIQEYNSTDSSSEYNIATWENFKGKDVTGEEGRAFALRKVRSDEVTNDINALFLLDNMDGLTLDQKAAYLISTSRNSNGDLMASYKVFGDDTIYKKEVYGTLPTNLTKRIESAVIVNVTSNGKVKVYENAYEANHDDGDSMNWKTVAGRVYEVNGSKLVVGTTGGKEYSISSNAVVWQKDKAVSRQDIDVDDVVVAVIHNGTIEAIEMLNIETLSLATVASDTTGSKMNVKAGEGNGSVADDFTGYYTTQVGPGWQFFDIDGARVATVID